MTKKNLLFILILAGAAIFLIFSKDSGFSSSQVLKKKHGAYWWVNHDPKALNQADYLCTKECKRVGHICGYEMAKCCSRESRCDRYSNTKCSAGSLKVNVQIDGRTFYCSD